MKLLERLFGIEIVEPEVKAFANTAEINETTFKLENHVAFTELLRKKKTERTADENALCALDFEFFDKMMLGEMPLEEYFSRHDEIAEIYAQLR